MKYNKDIMEKIEIVIFIAFLFLQNFAIIKTKGFGISALAICLVYLFFKYKMYLKIQKKLIIVLGGLFVFIIISSIVNLNFNILQIIRLYMIIFIFWATLQYIKIINNNGKIDFLYKTFYISVISITVYGIYQLIASKYGLPILLNVFNNNPSYGGKGIFEVYGGWTNTYRIYATFYEPSVYSIFLTIAYFFIINKVKNEKKLKYIITILVLINLFFTYARSGWITFLYFICIYLAFEIMKRYNDIKLYNYINQNHINKTIRILIILLPIITLVIMSTLGLYLFDDLSSKGRTYSSLYYLKESLGSIKSVLVGHGIGSVSEVPDGTEYNNYIIEKFAHNGYIDIMYQFGFVFFIILMVYIYKYLMEKKLNDNWMIYAVIYTICCFGSLYNIETIISLISMVIIATILEKEKKDDNNNLC